MKKAAKPWIMNLGMYEAGRPIEEVARELGFESTDDIIKVASNENALGPSPKAVQAMRKAAAKMHLYPDGGAFYLRRKLAGKFGLAPEQIMVANGSNEIIEFIGHVFLAPGDEMIMADRAFAIFRLVGLMFQANVVSVPMKNFKHDLPAMLKAITPRTKVVFIANPNNPTGTRVRNEDIYDFLDRVPEHVVVAMDEAYVELLPAGEQPDLLRYVRGGRRIIVLRTFSKSYGLAGLRVGYALAPAEGIELMQRVRQPFNVSAMALAAAEAALDDAGHLEKTREMVASGLAFFEKHLAALKIPFVPSCANFLLVNVGRGREVFKAMQKEKGIVRPMDGYGLPDHVRISVGLPSENARCIRALAGVLGRKGPEI